MDAPVTVNTVKIMPALDVNPPITLLMKASVPKNAMPRITKTMQTWYAPIVIVLANLVMVLTSLTAILAKMDGTCSMAVLLVTLNVRPAMDLLTPNASAVPIPTTSEMLILAHDSAHREHSETTIPTYAKDVLTCVLLAWDAPNVTVAMLVPN